MKGPMKVQTQEFIGTAFNFKEFPNSHVDDIGGESGSMTWFAIVFITGITVRLELLDMGTRSKTSWQRLSIFPLLYLFHVFHWTRDIA